MLVHTKRGTPDATRAPLILGIESSCDETAAAVVRGGRHILSSVVHSQAEMHARHGGVIPELAGRSHLQKILPVMDAALHEARVAPEDIDAVAVTTRPGLIGSLLVGLSAAKSWAWVHEKPLVPVHHIEAHIWAATMEHEAPSWPCIALVVSGGHSSIYRCDSPLAFVELARTKDDAAGEAFDKVAHILGLSYPGGPSVSKLAAQGDPRAHDFPRHRNKDGSLGFSFSGIKTAVLYKVRGKSQGGPLPPPEEIPDRAGLAASFEQAVCDVLVEQTLEAARREALDTVLVAGGVACNRRLREQMAREAARRGVRALFPSPSYCTDNAAMIAGHGAPLFLAGRVAGLGLDAQAS